MEGPPAKMVVVPAEAWHRLLQLEQRMEQLESMSTGLQDKRSSAAAPASSSSSKRAKRKLKQQQKAAEQAQASPSSAPASLPPAKVEQVSAAGVPTTQTKKEDLPSAASSSVSSSSSPSASTLLAEPSERPVRDEKPVRVALQTKSKEAAKPKKRTLPEDEYISVEMWNVSLPLWLLVGFLAWLVYSNGLSGSFVFNDDDTVVKNADVTGTTSFGDIFMHDSLGNPLDQSGDKLYQPLTTLSYRFNYSFNALNPTGYHIFNVLMHVFVCLLVYRLGTVLFNNDKSLAALAAAFFAVHPIHTDAVDSVTGRAEVLQAVLYLLSFLAYHRATTTQSTRWHLFVISLLFALLASLAKQSGITVLFVNLVFDLLYNCKVLTFVSHNRANQSVKWDKFLQRLALVCLFLLFFLLHRVYFVGSLAELSTSVLRNPLSMAGDNLTRLLSTLYLHFRAGYLLFVPVGLSYDYSFNCIPLVESLIDPRNLWTVFTYLALARFLVWSLSQESRNEDDSADERELLVLGLVGWVMLPFAPSAQMFFLTADMFTERSLYLPSIGFCILMAYLLHRGYKRGVYTQRTFVLLCVFILVAYSAATYLRNPVWDNNKALYESGMASCPNSVRVLYNQAYLLEMANKLSEAQNLYTQANNIYAADVDTIGRLARVHLRRGNHSGALTYYGRIINKDPKIFHEFAYFDVGLIYWRAGPGSVQKAYDFLRYAVGLYSDPQHAARSNPQVLAEARSVLGCVLMENNHANQSLELFQEAIASFPNHCGYHNNFAIALFKLNRAAEAEQVLRDIVAKRRSGEGDKSCLTLRANLDLISRAIENPRLPPPELSPSFRAP